MSERAYLLANKFRNNRMYCKEVFAIHLLLVLGSLSGISCSSEREQYEYCQQDTMRRDCPNPPCSGPYECVAFCIREYPVYEQGIANAPASGMGSWCDDLDIEGYGEFCFQNQDVDDCKQWCDDHGHQCQAKEVADLSDTRPM